MAQIGRQGKHFWLLFGLLFAGRQTENARAFVEATRMWVSWGNRMLRASYYFILGICQGSNRINGFHNDDNEIRTNDIFQSLVTNKAPDIYVCSSDLRFVMKQLGRLQIPLLPVPCHSHAALPAPCACCKSLPPFVCQDPGRHDLYVAAGICYA